MVELSQLSKIGFGGYRISLQDKEHYEALQYALRQGCNLIDTAPNYTHGDSEKLIGKVLASNKKTDAFVITKAGYVLEHELQDLQKTIPNLFTGNRLVQTADNSYHSIHPDYLNRQLSNSLGRLNREYVDGFLLHNPEYYFDNINGEPNAEEYYNHIAKAFEFLEAKARTGVIRYYGVSSNTFTASDTSGGTNLNRLIEIAEKMASSHHFKLIQFPHNMVENNATKTSHHPSLHTIARNNGIVCIANRPLNANTATGPVRLALYDQQIAALNEAKDKTIVDHFITMVADELKKNNIQDDPLEFTPIQVIHSNWDCFETTDIADIIFANHLIPFVHKLFGEPTGTLAKSLSKLKQTVSLYARKRMMESSTALMETITSQLTDPENISDSFSSKVCRHYLEEGIDHILVGMRHKNYVDDLKKLFTYEKIHSFSAV